MAHELGRLSASLTNKPQLITPDTFNHYLSIIDDRSMEVIKANHEAKKLAIEEGVDSEASGADLGATVGVLSIDGPLTYKSSGFEALCGGASYQSILAQAKTLFSNPEISTVVQMVSSGGGEAFAVMNTASELRKLADQSGKRLITYVDGMSASAAYALGCASHEIIMHPDAEVGSIGVVVRLTNSNEAEKKAGVETTYITAGDSKVPFDANGEFREDFKADLQSKVDSLYLDFINHVATMRNISPETVMDTQAKMFMKEKALELGLADKVMTPTEFKEYLKQEDLSPSAPSVTTKTNLPKAETIALTNETQDIEMSDAINAQALADLQAQLQAANDLVASFEAEKTQAKQASLVASLSTENTFLESDTIEALASVMLSDEKASTLLSSVLSQAKAGIDAEKEASLEAIAAATLEKEEAIAAKDAIKAEFGNQEQQSVSVEAKDNSATVSVDAVAERVARMKAAKAKK